MYFNKFLLLVALATSAIAEERHCYANENSPFTQFSTRTPYGLVSGNDISGSAENCAVSKIWALVSPGASLPSEEEFAKLSELSSLKDSVVENHFRWGTGELCAKDLYNLRSWNFSSEFRHNEQHINEVTSFAQRLKQKLLASLEEHSHKFSVQHADTPVTVNSANAFIEALKDNINTPSPSIKNILITEQNCPGWTESTNSEEALRESELFKGKVIAEVAHNVSSRLGFQKDIEVGVILDLFNLCSYETALGGSNNSPLCSVFTTNELEALEYFEDLVAYYRYGHGNSNTQTFGCSLVYDLLLSFYKSIQDKDHSSNVYFGNSQNLRSTLVSLGLAQDKEPITSENFESAGFRAWRNSQNTPMNGNILAVLHKCDGDELSSLNYYIELFLNEKKVNLDWCGSPCTLDKFRDHYLGSISKEVCNLDFC